MIKDRYVVMSGLEDEAIDFDGVRLTLHSDGVKALNTAATAPDTVVSSGQTSSGVVVSAGTSQTVLHGGIARSTTVDLNGAQFVYGLAVDTLLDGGYQFVYGAADDTTLVVAQSGGQFYGAVQDVASGGVASGVTLSNGGYEYVDGVADAVIISSGGLEFIDQGGLASDVRVASGGYGFVSSGARADTVFISNGGMETVGSGGRISGVTVLNGGELILSAGAVVEGEVVSSGGIVIADTVVSSGRTSNRVVVSSGASQTVLAGGLARNTTVDPDGTQIVSGSASVTLLDGGQQYVYGAADSTTLFGGEVSGVFYNAYQSVSSGGVASGVMLSSFGYGNIYSGGTAEAVTISSGGAEEVFSGGTVSGVTVLSGGVLVLSAGAIASNVTLSSGATEIAYMVVPSGEISSGVTVYSSSYLTVLSGGTASSTILSGGYEAVESGGRAVGVMVDSGGFEDTAAGGSVSSIVVNSGGSAFLDPSAAATGTLINGGAFEVIGGADSNVTFGGSGGVLTLDDAAAFSGIISGFSSGDTLDLTNVTSVTSVTWSSGILAVTDAQGDVIDLRASGLARATFSTQADDLNGTAITIGGAVNLEPSILDATLSRFTWSKALSKTVHLTYSFMTKAQPGDGATGFKEISSADQAIVTQAIKAFSAAAGVTFTLVANGGGADIMFGEDAQAGTGGITRMIPGNGPAPSGFTAFSAAHVYFSTSNGPNTWLVLHELGNAVGLRDFSGESYNADASQGLPLSAANFNYTVMANNFPDHGSASSPYSITPQILDVQALQYLYGANESGYTRAGAAKTSYGLVYKFHTNNDDECIWVGDAVAGVTSFDFSASTGAVTINLNAGAFSSTGVTAAGTNVSPSLVGTPFDDVSIAYGTTINVGIANGQAGNLIADGTASHNDVLIGGAGNDDFTAGGGQDIFVGGGGVDTAIFHDAYADYTVVKASSGMLVVTDVGNNPTDGVTVLDGDFTTLQFANRTIKEAASSLSPTTVVAPKTVIDANSEALQSLQASGRVTKVTTIPDSDVSAIVGTSDASNFHESPSTQAHALIEAMAASTPAFGVSLTQTDMLVHNNFQTVLASRLLGHLRGPAC